MSLSDDIADLVESIGKSNSVTFVLGSAISFPSGVPSVPDILDCIEYTVLEKSILSDPVKELFSDFWIHKWEMPFEELVKQAQVIWPDLVDEIKKCFAQSSTPTFNHQAISYIANSVKNCTIITTNWDNLLENAMRLPGKNNWISYDNTIIYRKKEAGINFQIIKVHGTVEEEIVALLDQMIELPIEVQPDIEKALNADSVILAGYSASDVDLRPILYSKRPESNWFWIEKYKCDQTDNNPPKVAQRELYSITNSHSIIGDLTYQSSPLVELAKSLGNFDTETKEVTKQKLKLPEVIDEKRIIAFIGNASYWFQHSRFCLKSHELWKLKSKDKIPIEQKIDPYFEKSPYDAYKMAKELYKISNNDFERYCYKSMLPFYTQQAFQYFIKRVNLNFLLLLPDFIIGFFKCLSVNQYELADEKYYKDSIWIGSLALKEASEKSISVSIYHKNVALDNYYNMLSKIPFIKRLLKIENIIKEFENLRRIFKINGEFKRFIDCNITINIRNYKNGTISKEVAIENLNKIRNLFLHTERINGFVETCRRISDLYLLDDIDYKSALDCRKNALKYSKGKIDKHTFSKLIQEIENIEKRVDH
ncbi:SIR2 family protein [Candidatus Latescibacterota bacterium]